MYVRTVPEKPASEVRIDEALVRHLVTTQGRGIPSVSTLPLRKVAEGWDSEVWRLGDDYAVRLPRRAVAAPLVRHEHLSLPILAPAIEASGVRVPLPLVQGAPEARYPWAWSVVPWIAGDRGMDVPRFVRAGWAETLAHALSALHVPAPSDAPVNPFRGGPLSTRDTAFRDRLGQLVASAIITEGISDRLERIWQDGLRAPAWSRSPVWIHGDLHPGNLVAAGPQLTAIIDFGDVTAGDPAYDLAIAWLAFDADGRERFVTAFADAHDSATWVRARAWAAAVALLLLAHSDDEATYAALGREALAEVASGS